MTDSTGQGVTVPSAPPLASLANVELMHTGQWDISTGTVTFTKEDLAAAVAALGCPAIRKPVLKLGHTDPRFDGEPACGWISNMATTNSGSTLVGDYTGMPGWLGSILPSAYPDRSIEGAWDFRCQIGHVHPFVITAVALLGVTPPGIGTLESLQDVAAMYGVAASPQDSGTPFIVHAKGDAMPNPNPVQVAAAVTTEDIRRKFYEIHATDSTWISEMQLEPLQLIAMDDSTGEFSRIPVNVSGEDVEFGDAVPVKMVFQDSPKTAAASANAIRYASREESRNVAPARESEPVPEKKPEPAPVSAKDAIQKVHKASEPRKGAGMDPGKIREALGLSPDASDDEVSTALASAGLVPKTAEPPKDQNPEPVAASLDPAKLPEGVMVLDASVVKALQAQAARGDAAFKEIQRNRRDQVLASAVESGKFPPSRLEHWTKLWDMDPEGTERQVNSLAPGLVPVSASGYPGTETYEQDNAYYGLYPEEKPNG